MTKILRSALIALLTMCYCAMKAETVEYTTDDGFAYSLNTEIQEASLMTYSGDASEIVIPKIVTYEGKEYKVTSLGEECFGDYWSLTSIVLPASVTSLGRGCFRNCRYLTSIEIPSSVESLGRGCFENCVSLPSIEIPASVTNLGDFCFVGCYSLTSIEIPASVTNLGNYCFYNCQKLTSIEIPASVTSLGGDCFTYCKKLTSIEIPASVTSLGNGCFYGCSSLESIVIDSNNSVYDSREGCNAIIETKSNTMIVGCKKTRILSSVTSLGDECFHGCEDLTSIEIPSSVTSLGDGCFSACSSLTSIEIPSSVTSLGDCCFSACSSLTSIEIPSSVASVGSNCFAGCPSIESIVVDATNPVYDSREGCNAIIETESNTMIAGCKNTRIPSSVTSLGDLCFCDCSSLTSIEIPASVTSLEEGCFRGCRSLHTVICKMENVIEDESIFDWIPLEDVALYVPEELLDAYQSTSPWSRFGTIRTLEEIPVEYTTEDGFVYGLNMKTQEASLDKYNGDTNEVIIPEIVTYEGKEYKVTSLRRECFSGCSSLTSIEIPASVTSLRYNCFEACHSLTSIELPLSLTHLGHNCFSGCISLASVVSKIEEPFEITEGLYPFNGMYWGGTLTVPYGTKDAYIAAGWDIFPGDIVEESIVVELDENSQEAPTAQENATAHVKRSINADEWSTIVLPFDMTEEQVKEAFGDDVQLADFAGYETIGDAGEVTCIQVNFNAATSIKANTPCLIKVGMDIREFTVEGVNVVPVEKPLVEAVLSTESQWSKMVGCYVAGIQVEKNCLFFSGNKFWYSTGATKMKGYRAYFDFSDILSSVENAEAKVRLAINGDGTTTGVESVKFGARKENGSWYSLDGRRLTGKPTEKGIYIVNGKKVAIN